MSLNEMIDGERIATLQTRSTFFTQPLICNYSNSLQVIQEFKIN